MDIFNVFTLFGGLGMFLFGMDIMGKALEKQAGNKLQTILKNDGQSFKRICPGYDCYGSNPKVPQPPRSWWWVLSTAA